MKNLVFVTILMLPFLSFSQQTDNKVLNKKNKVIAVAVKKQVNPQAIHNECPTYIYSDEYRNANGVPEDFPKYINTGNSKTDAAHYYQQKQLWIKNNPERFEKIKHLAL